VVLQLPRGVAPWLALTKPAISATVTLSAAAAHILAAERVSLSLLAVAGGIFLTAAGACSLNEVQERALDARMPRTQARPLPAGRLSPGPALLAALTLAGTGVLLLWTLAGPTAAILALGGMFWYNAVYTPLKKITAFAVIPGALVGAAAPAIGWTAAGQPLWDPRLGALAFFFFMWQVPHFWLLAARYGEEYRRAGLPSVTELFDERQLGRIIFVWCAAAGASCLLLFMFGAVVSAEVFFLLSGCALLLGLSAVRLLRPWNGTLPPRFSFAAINAFCLAVMALMASDPYLR